MLKKNYSADIINQLKATKTVFFIRKNNMAYLDSLKKAISAAWDLTPLIFDDIANFDTYAGNSHYSYFNIEGFSTTSISQSGSYSSTHYYLALRLFKDIGRKGKINTTGLCRIELYPNFELLMAAQVHSKSSDVVNEMYENGIFYNWNPVLLKAQIGTVCTNLKNNSRPWLFQEIRSSDLSQLLSQDTLYIPKKLLMSFSGFTGHEKAKDENIFSAYIHPYKICTDSELYNIFVTQQRGRFLFEYVKSSSDKFITVYDLKQKNIVYKSYTAVSYNVKSKDIERIN